MLKSANKYVTYLQIIARSERIAECRVCETPNNTKYSKMGFVLDIEPKNRKLRGKIYHNH